MRDFLLTSRAARRLYREHAADLPIIDYHNHLSPWDMTGDRRFSDITELWLAADPYKHRLMRIAGVPEQYITGDADPYEKFEKFASAFPYFAGNPVYDFCRMELGTVFGIHTLPDAAGARRLYDRCNEMLASPEFSARGILSRFAVEYQSPVASLFDDLTPYDGVRVAPSLRGDELLAPREATLTRLADATGVAPVGDGYFTAIARLLDRHHAAGCRFADHALDDGFFAREGGEGRARLLRLCGEYAARGWTLLLHIGAKRNTSPRLARLAGPAGGYAAAGESFATSALCDLLGEAEAGGGLPDTVIFPLNMGDIAPLATLQGSFAEDGTPAKVQVGPAWWWCDHEMGIRHTLSSVASFGLLSQFIGMTTDSRSILSFVRHDYFRRILCSFLAERAGAWGLPPAALGEITRRICYQNAKDKLTKKKEN